MREALLHAVGELLYTHNLAEAKELDLLGHDMPLIKTGCDPMAVKPPSQIWSVINNRRQSLCWPCGSIWATRAGPTASKPRG